MHNDNVKKPDRLYNKLFGGIEMTWVKVILFAVITALVTAVFLIMPVFKNTSFERMGVYLEAWIFFAIIVISNCKKPLEAAIKTFVFFLISQPLIYLFQVPFASMGWGLLSYYKNWIIPTILTFPGAFIGWFITKKNWLSVLVLSPVLGSLGYILFQCAESCVRSFPHYLLAAVFCLVQIVLYILAFLSNKLQKLVGAAVPIVVIAILLLNGKAAPDVNGTMFLPDDPILTDEAVVVMEENTIGEISIESTGKDSMIRVHANAFGTFAFSILDGENEYAYEARIYTDQSGYTQIEILEK